MFTYTKKQIYFLYNGFLGKITRDLARDIEINVRIYFHVPAFRYQSFSNKNCMLNCRFVTLKLNEVLSGSVSKKVSISQNNVIKHVTPQLPINHVHFVRNNCGTGN